MRTVTNDGVAIAYTVDGEGPPVVWLQGLNADHTAWAAQVAAFRGEFRCILIDNRDVGRSGRADGPYRTADMAGDVRAVLDELGTDDVHVVGLSLGGAIAQELALAWPEWVRSLTLVSTFARPDARMVEILEAWRLIYPKLGPADFARQAWPWLFTWRHFERPSNVRALRRYGEHGIPQEPEAFARQIEASLAHDTQDRLATLAIPALVVAGAEDMVVTPHLVRQLAAAIPGAQYVELPEAGHSGNLEARTEFNRAVRDFLRAH